MSTKKPPGGRFYLTLAVPNSRSYQAFNYFNLPHSSEYSKLLLNMSTSIYYLLFSSGFSYKLLDISKSYIGADHLAEALQDRLNDEV